MTSLNRRNVLRLGGIAALAGTAGPALVGCGGGGSAGEVGNKGKDLAPYPTYVPFTGPEPDLLGDDTGLQNAYLKYPSSIQPAGFDTPGDGSEVTASVITYGVPPSDVDTDKYVQAVHAALGIKLKLTLIPGATFKEKMSTMMTGEDLPDIIMFGAGEVLPQEEQFVQAKCADLSDLISGDNIKDYPALANIPPYAWKGLGRISGKLYGIPTERPVFGGCLMVNRTALDAAGVPIDWDVDGFNTAMSELTAGKKYGMGLSNDFQPDFFAGSFGAPNFWGVEGGKFVTTYASDGYKQAIDMLAKLYKDGYASPDSPNIPNTDNKINFANATVSCYRDGWGAMGTTAFKDARDGFTVDFGQPLQSANTNSWGGTGRFGYVAFKQADAKRIKMLLGVANFLASPFGTTEYELFNFGVEDQHFTRDEGGTPMPTKLWETSNKTNYPVSYIASAPIPLFYNGYPDRTEAVYEWEKVVAPLVVPDPSNGIRSASWTKKGAQLQTAIQDAYKDVVFRGKDLSSFDEAVAQWKADGGDTAAEEFAEEYAIANE